MLSIFLKDYSKGSRTISAAIEQEVDVFFKSEKINEASLKELKSRVLAIVGGKAPSTVSSQKLPPINKPNNNN